MSSDDKFLIAKNIAKGIASLQAEHKPPAHSHLSSKNIMLNPSDHEIYITDYNLKSLKKFCKIFHKYRNVNAWSAPEVWEAHPNSEVPCMRDFYDSAATDVYSYGILLWELESGKVPFAGMSDKEIKEKLCNDHVRPVSSI